VKRRAVLGILVASIALTACGKPAQLKMIQPGKTVLAFGDSVTFGTGASAGEGWPTLLANQTGWAIVNAGIPGDTAEAGKQRIEVLLDEHQPALIIIEIGGNDFLHRRSPKAVKEDIRSMIQAAKNRGAQVVLVAVPELSLIGAVTRKPTEAPLYRELGEEEKVPVVSDVFAEILGKPELCADQIHPNAKGYRQMASGLYSSLQKVGLVPAGRN